MSTSTETVKAACPHDCPDTCAMEVTVEQRGGRRVAVKVAGSAAHAPTQGVLCTKVSRYLERTYHPERVLRPLKRVGRKGEGRFVPVSWDEALTDIAQRLQAIAAVDPQRIVPYSYAGTMGLVQGESMAQRFFHKLGASLLDRTICATAGAEALTYTLGTRTGTDPERFADSGLIIFWGCNAIASNLHLWSRAQEAKRKGAKLIAIDPYRSLTAEKCHQHIALLPGTDGALALKAHIDLPPLPPSPCDGCKGQPCRTACPAAALTGAGYDLPACHAWLDSPAGQDCMTCGCAVRRACPVSARHARMQAQSAYHMRQFHR